MGGSYQQSNLYLFIFFALRPLFLICYCWLFICLHFSAYLSARFDASRAGASALVHFAQVHPFLVVRRSINLSVVYVSLEYK